METERKTAAAYLPLATLLTALDHLKAISIPNKIEPGTFPSMSSQSKSQLLSGLRFFDLITEDGTPKPLLSDLAYKTDERKALIRQLIETHYPDIVALDFAKITPSQLDAALAGKKYNVQGETRKKAKTFLLKAAQFSGFKVHPLLTKITRNRVKAGTKKNGVGADKLNSTGSKGDDAPPADKPSQSHPATENGTKKTIQLKRGGSLTLSLAVNLLEIEGEDRKFVFGLIDQLQAYERGMDKEDQS